MIISLLFSRCCPWHISSFSLYHNITNTKQGYLSLSFYFNYMNHLHFSPPYPPKLQIFINIKLVCHHSIHPTIPLRPMLIHFSPEHISHHPPKRVSSKTSSILLSFPAIHFPLFPPYPQSITYSTRITFHYDIFFSPYMFHSKPVDNIFKKI